MSDVVKAVVFDEGGAVFNVRSLPPPADDDWAPLIQQALADHTVVFIPAGDYNLRSSILIARSGVTLMGAGKSVTRLHAVPTGLEPEPPAIQITGSELLSDISIHDLQFVAVTTPRTRSSVEGGTAMVRLSLRNLHLEQMIGLGSFHELHDFEIRSITGFQTENGVAFFDSGRGIVTDLRFDTTNEAVDTFNCEDIVVSGVIATAAETFRDEKNSCAFDNGSSRRITLMDSTVTGFNVGVKVKAEPTGGQPAVPYHDFLISNIVVDDVREHGIHVVGSGNNGSRNVQIQGCVVRGDSPKAAAGIRVGDDDAVTEPLTGMVVAGCTVDIAAPGIDVINVTNPVVEGCQVRSTAPPATLPATPTASPTAGVLLRGCTRPRIAECTVESLGNAAVFVFNSLQPRVVNVEVLCADEAGIVVQWDGDDGLDQPNRVAGAIVNGNVVRGYSRAAPRSPGIAIHLDGVTGSAPYNLVQLVGNCVYADGDGVKDPAGIVLVSNVPLDFVRMTENVIYGMALPIAGQELLGSHSTPTAEQDPRLFNTIGTGTTTESHSPGAGKPAEG
jgi:hypothetical protein